MTHGRPRRKKHRGGFGICRSEPEPQDVSPGTKGHPWARSRISSEVQAPALEIAIADQVEDPALAKGLVRREVVRVVTPGVVLAQAARFASERLLAPAGDVRSEFDLADGGIAELADLRASAAFVAGLFAAAEEQPGSLLAASAVTAGLVRLSVGLESIDDILADLEAGFAAAK